MENSLERYKKKLQEKDKEMAILMEICQAITYNWDLKDTLQAIIKIVHSYTRSDSCLVYLIEDQQLVLEASQNSHRNLDTIILRKGEGVTGWAAEHNRTVMLPTKAYEDRRFKVFNNLPEDRFESFLCVPIVFKSKVIGVFNVQNRRPRRYSKEEILFLEAIAKPMGSAIENARLITETQMLKDALETRKFAEKAKGILMRKFGLTETEAHRLLNKKTMDVRKTLKEVAEAIILSEEFGK